MLIFIYVWIYNFKQELKRFTCICVTKPGDLPLKVGVCRQQVVDAVAQNCCHCWKKKQINHHRSIRYFQNSLGVVSHAFGGHWQKSTDFTCNVNGLYVTIADQIGTSINMISSFEAANDFGDWKNHHQINVIATSIQNPCFCEIVVKSWQRHN